MPHRVVGRLQVLLLCVLMASQLTGQAAAPQERVVLTSFSGGIAKGSYQGGVDYVVTEFLRRQRDTVFRRQMGIAHHPPYRLGASTGASAGNINALLASMSWCAAGLRDRTGNTTAAFIAPEQSLFWNIWVNTGFTHLLKDNSGGGGEPAVLDRTFFEKTHMEALLEFLQRAEPMADCRVPLGVTLTKLSPVKVSLVKGRGTASVQRFASVAEVVTRTDGGPLRIDFVEAPPNVPRAASLGALAMLKGLGRNTGTTQAHLDTLYKAVVASSSFPVAFAPVKLCYDHAGLELAPTEPKIDCAKFMDGGLFDNNPFGLALRLYELNPGANGLSSNVNVVYSNPNRYRAPLEAARKPSSEVAADREGLSAVLQLLSGAWSAGTEYELQSLARTIERDLELALPPGAVANPTMLLSSRSAPIVGEQLNSFAGFLGRPFREYDFYTGVYDGLEFIARHFICDGSPDANCPREAHDRLVLTNAFQLGEFAHAVTRWQRARERDSASLASIRAEDAKRADKAQDPIAGARWRMLAAIDSAATHLLRDVPHEDDCKFRGDLVGSRMCLNGFLNFMDALADDEVAFESAKLMAKWCDEHPSEFEAGRCPADGQFVELLAGPRWYLHGVVEQAIENLENVEDAIKEKSKGLPEVHEKSALVELAFALYRTASMRYRTGVEFNPSSARWDHSRWSRRLGSFFLGTVLPNYVSLGLGRASVREREAAGLSRLRSTSFTAGWRPVVFYPWETAYLSSVFELSGFTDATPARQDRKTDFAVGGSFGLRSWLPGVSSLELGALSTNHLFSQESEAVNDRDVVINLAARFAAEKVYVGLKTSPERRTFSVSLGLSDLNGLVYWWIR